MAAESFLPGQSVKPMLPHSPMRTSAICRGWETDVLMENPPNLRSPEQQREASSPLRASLLAHDELRLRHDCRELAVAPDDPGLPNHGGAAAMQRRTFRPQGVAERHCGKEVGLAFD